MSYHGNISFPLFRPFNSDTVTPRLSSLVSLLSPLVLSFLVWGVTYALHPLPAATKNGIFTPDAAAASSSDGEEKIR